MADDETTAGPASAGRCPRCNLPKQPAVPECDTEGWPCYHPFHENWAEGFEERREAFRTAMTKQPLTPELDKMAKAREEGSETIGAFLEWLQGKGLVLCTWIEEPNAPEGWRPDSRGIQRLLADYFGVDLVKVEAERLALLEYVREQS